MARLEVSIERSYYLGDVEEHLTVSVAGAKPDVLSCLVRVLTEAQITAEVSDVRRAKASAG